MTELVTLGDLLTIGVDRIRRPATVADLMSPEIRPLVVSALRAEGVLVVEKVDGEWFFPETSGLLYALFFGEKQFMKGLAKVLDALAEAQGESDGT